jgi:CBS domain-containing protein
MYAASKPLLTLTAGDLMTAPVTTIHDDISLREAAQLLAEANISGAPVVDAQGRCRGVLSSHDFLTWAGATGKSIHFMAPDGELIDLVDAPDAEVDNYMTAQPVMVTPLTPIGDLAQMMIDAHIHRVLVVVDQAQPRGIVTSTDILAAVAQEARKAVLKVENKPKRKSRVPH